MPRETPLDRETALAFGTRLQILRKAAGLTQERAAERAHMSRNHFQLLESGLSDRAKKSPANPCLGTLVNLATVLGCTVGDLVEGIPGAGAVARREPEIVVTAVPAHARARRTADSAGRLRS